MVLVAVAQEALEVPGLRHLAVVGPAEVAKVGGREELCDDSGVDGLGDVLLRGASVDAVAAVEALQVAGAAEVEPEEEGPGPEDSGPGGDLVPVDCGVLGLEFLIIHGADLWTDDVRDSAALKDGGLLEKGFPSSCRQLYAAKRESLKPDEKKH
jgi:hypothetical protein